MNADWLRPKPILHPEDHFRQRLEVSDGFLKSAYSQKVETAMDSLVIEIIPMDKMKERKGQEYVRTLRLVGVVNPTEEGGKKN